MKGVKRALVTALLSLPLTAISGEKESHYNFRYVKYFQSSTAFAKASGSGSIEGRVVYVGKRKLENKKKLITKDKEVCGTGYKIEEVYVISGDGGVKNAVVFVDEVGNPPKETVRLVQEKCEFHPRVMAMGTGSTLEVVNNDTVKHEANGVQDFETIFHLSQHKQGMVDRVDLKKTGSGGDNLQHPRMDESLGCCRKQYLLRRNR